MYCITVCGYGPDVHTDKVQRLQNKAARIVSGSYDWAVRGNDIVKLLNSQIVRERRDYFIYLVILTMSRLNILLEDQRVI